MRRHGNGGTHADIRNGRSAGNDRHPSQPGGRQHWPHGCGHQVGTGRYVGKSSWSHYKGTSETASGGHNSSRHSWAAAGGQERSGGKHWHSPPGSGGDASAAPTRGTPGAGRHAWLQKAAMAERLQAAHSAQTSGRSTGHSWARTAEERQQHSSNHRPQQAWPQMLPDPTSRWLGNQLDACRAKGSAAAGLPLEPCRILVVNNSRCEAYSWLLEDIAQADVVGFDSEWVPEWGTDADHPISVLQLAFPFRRWVYVIQLGKSRGKLHRLPPEVQRMLVNPEVLKVGFAVGRNDMVKLKQCGIGVGDVTAVDTQSLCEWLLGWHASGSLGLGHAARLLLGINMVKDKRISCSDWDREVLTPDQIRYAAMDAWVPLQLLAVISSAATLGPWRGVWQGSYQDKSRSLAVLGDCAGGLTFHGNGLHPALGSSSTVSTVSSANWDSTSSSTTSSTSSSLPSEEQMRARMRISKGEGQSATLSAAQAVAGEGGTLPPALAVAAKAAAASASARTAIAAEGAASKEEAQGAAKQESSEAAASKAASSDDDSEGGAPFAFGEALGTTDPVDGVTAAGASGSLAGLALDPEPDGEVSQLDRPMSGFQAATSAFSYTSFLCVDDPLGQRHIMAFSVLLLFMYPSALVTFQLLPLHMVVLLLLIHFEAFPACRPSLISSYLVACVIRLAAALMVTGTRFLVEKNSRELETGMSL
eukprot:TRINITY_DN66674_c0_g1_i1.p1 TRINITY_DN66674_c0_g1~~TRINITY_DN66674_c0_g1_i1.p1  ORF type:complete len:702 (+),score=131.13 TRINITY_DN66674_c0_g1_i1:132-2237(+)